MRFRDRPEYNAWRAAVIELFGRKCIKCGHPSNIHVHHVQPVHTYPELTFDPKNGVPLCGNCHSEVNGNELEYIEELERLQQAILNDVDAVSEQATTETPTKQYLDELQREAEACPSDAELVADYFRDAPNAQSIVDFYNTHRMTITKTPRLYWELACRLSQLQRWDAVIQAFHNAARFVEKEEGVSEWCHILADEVFRLLTKSEVFESWFFVDSVDGEEFLRKPAMRERRGSLDFPTDDWDDETSDCSIDEKQFVEDAIVFLRDLTSRFPDDAYLHFRLSATLWAKHVLPEPNSETREAAKHARMSVSLSPAEIAFALYASSLFLDMEDCHLALNYGNHALSLATSTKERVSALFAKACAFYFEQFWAEARKCVQQILRLEEHNTRALGRMALSRCSQRADWTLNE